jgi:hypothetical protein
VRSPTGIAWSRTDTSELGVLIGLVVSLASAATSRSIPPSTHERAMTFIMRRSGGRWIVWGFFFFFSSLYNGGTWPVPCCRAFLLPASPTAAQRRRRQHQQQQQQQLQAPHLSLSMLPPAVDLISQSTMDASYSCYFLSNVHSAALGSTDLLLGTDATLHAMANVMDPSMPTAQLLGMPDDAAQAAAAYTAPGALSPTTTVLVFVAGLIPFAVATVEFWRRVALQLPFGTGNKEESVLIVIGDDNDRQLSRGRRVLGKDALIVAIVLFGVAASVVAIVVASVLTSTPPPPPGAY